MKKNLIISSCILGLITLSACSNHNDNSKNLSGFAQPKHISSQKNIPTSTHLESSISKSSSSNYPFTSSSTNNGISTTTSTSTVQPTSPSISNNYETNNPLAGYSTEQIEYARVTETLLHYYHNTGQPISISVIRNVNNHPIFPFPGSISLPYETVSLLFSTKNTMASTIAVTYRSNHNGSITFYKDPNHSQDERYLKDPNWVKQQSEKLLNSARTLNIPTTYVHQAAMIINYLNIK